MESGKLVGQVIQCNLHYGGGTLAIGIVMVSLEYINLDLLNLHEGKIGYFNVLNAF